MKLLYPTSITLDIDSLKGFSVDLCPYDVSKPIPEDLTDAEAMITWTNSNLKDAASRMKNLKWIQSLAAGPNDVLNAGFDASKITITTGSGLHDQTVAEHALGLLLLAARKFHEMRDFQTKTPPEWPQHLGGPQPDRPKGSFTSLADANVTIWGFGNIAKALVPSLRALGANIKGIATRKGVRDGIEVFSEEEIESVLKGTDALVMILPGSEKTKHALNKERLKMLPNHAWIVNVGRGTTIDEDALSHALEDGSIGGAALDVFATEPLPTESKLWGCKNCFVSPHAAGGRPRGAEALIAENLRRFLAGQELKNVI